ncbi:MAG: hypothetical protein A2X08_14090 [Bacteroidetes bacterium GWA2_32_17]|nr:MAG: hypothetical protein A2X08_14090 [Bacteroidetes bacterium GWA2_32_17]
MKHINFKIVFSLLVIITFSNFMAKSQITYLSGTGTNNCATGAGTSGASCTFIGCGAGIVNTAKSNTFVGDSAGGNNIKLNDNVAIGHKALFTQSNNGATPWYTYNVAVGNQALYSNNPTSSTSGISNTAIGHNALYNNTIGDDNTAVGFYAGRATTTGNDNTFLGYRAGKLNNTGSNNTFIGRLAGQTVTTNGNNTCVGNGADIPSTYTNCTALGYGAVTGASNDYVQIGNTSVATIHGQVAFTSSDRRIKNNIKENVPGLAFINLLKPVTYHLNIHEENRIIGYPSLKDSLDNVIGIDTMYWEGKYDIEKINYSGLIAQQVDSAAQQIGYNFSGIYKPKSSNDLYSLSYAQMVVPLIKAVQELSNKYDSLLAIISPAGNTKSMQNTSGGKGENENKQEIKLKLPVEIMMSEARPNPNDGKAEIDYYLPSSVLNAKIIFTDMLGNVIKEVQLTTGYGTIAVDTMELPNGTYTFSLVTDGKVYNTKKMLRNK